MYWKYIALNSAEEQILLLICEGACNDSPAAQEQPFFETKNLFMSVGVLAPDPDRKVPP